MECAARGGTIASLTEYLSRDGRRLEEWLGEGRAHVANGRWPDAVSSHVLFERGVERHVRLEEEIVFPLFEARSGIVDGPTAVMREEHRCLRRALSMMRAAVEARDAAAYEDAVTFLCSVRSAHDAKAERILYPMTDRLLAPRERARVVARLQRE